MSKRYLQVGMAASAALLALAAPALAQDATEAMASSEVPEYSVFVFNTTLFLIGGFLVMWMAAGFSMLEAGLVRSKNVSMQCTKNIGLFSIAAVALFDRLQFDVSARLLVHRNRRNWRLPRRIRLSSA